MRRTVVIFAFFAAFTAHMTAPALKAQEKPPADAAQPQPEWTWDDRAARKDEIRRDTPSGLPVPRFVSLKTEKTFCRAGPSFSHPVRITFMRKGLPLVVIAETRDHWRKVRDVEGDECWTHRSKLSGARTALVIEDGLTVRARPDAAAPARARLGEGLIARVEEVDGRWARVTAGGARGWTRKSGLWGALPDDAFAALHN